MDYELWVLDSKYKVLGGGMSAIIIWVETSTIHVLLGTIGDEICSMLTMWYLLFIYNCLYIFETNGVRLEECSSFLII